MFNDRFEDLDVQPSEAEAPLTIVAICALEVGALRLSIGWNIPAPAPLVRHE